MEGPDGYGYYTDVTRIGGSFYSSGSRGSGFYAGSNNGSGSGSYYGNYDSTPYGSMDAGWVGGGTYFYTAFEYGGSPGLYEFNGSYYGDYAYYGSGVMGPMGGGRMLMMAELKSVLGLPWSRRRFLGYS